MRLSIACLGLAFLAPRVLANDLSGPYQTMLLWYAYRLDIAAGGTFIAPGCIGTDEGKRCYFDEFLEYIEGGDGPRWSGRTSVGTNLAPNVLSTAEELANSGYSNVVDPEVIYEEPPGYKNFRGLFEPAINNIQKCRRELTEKGISFDWELNGIRTAMANTLDARIADNAPYIVDGVNDKLAETGFSWTAETKPVTGLDGTTWHEVDVEATIKAHPNDAFEGLDDAINDYILHFDQQPSENNSNKRHMRAIWASETFASRVLGDPDC